MKKIVSLLLCIVLVASFCVTAFAANYNDQLKEAGLAVLPDEYEDVYVPQVDKIIDQLDVTEDQYIALKAILDDVAETVDLTKGASLDAYTQAEKDYAIAQFNAACEILGLTYEVVGKAGVNDVVYVIYDAEGNKLGEIDGDLTPSKTDSAMPSYAWALIVLAAVVVAGGAVVFARKNNIAE